MSAGTEAHSPPFVEVQLGNDVELPCNYNTTAPTQCLRTITWTKNGRLVYHQRTNHNTITTKEGEGYEGRVELLPGRNKASLKIKPVLPNDGGEYRCYVSISCKDGGASYTVTVLEVKGQELFCKYQ